MSRARPRAVVADDSHFMRSVISDILEEGGIDVVGEARNGREALERVGECDPDVVTMAGETLIKDDKITANLQNTVMDMRLIPLKKVVGKFPRMVRDLARELDKEVEFGVEGEIEEGMLVRIRESERQVALNCDAVNAQEEVVVKPLEGLLSGTPGLSGTAVLGDGNIVHILDVVTL